MAQQRTSSPAEMELESGFHSPRSPAESELDRDMASSLDAAALLESSFDAAASSLDAAELASGSAPPPLLAQWSP